MADPNRHQIIENLVSEAREMLQGPLTALDVAIIEHAEAVGEFYPGEEVFYDQVFSGIVDNYIWNVVRDEHPELFLDSEHSILARYYCNTDYHIEEAEEAKRAQYEGYLAAYNMVQDNVNDPPANTRVFPATAESPKQICFF